MKQDAPEPPWHIPDAELHPSLLVRVVLLVLGSIALLLGIIGIVVPGLPTTPFILVAAACYARASERFYRWLSLLLFDVQKSGYIERVLTEQALARASLMERLGRRARQAGVNPDQLFLAGLFSQLEKLLDRPLAEILDSVAMPPAVNEALLTGSGPLAPFLNLAVACENGDQKATAIWATACQLDALSVNQELLAALVWANEVLEMDD